MLNEFVERSSFVLMCMTQVLMTLVGNDSGWRFHQSFAARRLSLEEKKVKIS